MHYLERWACARSFLTKVLTPRELDLVIAFSLGFSASEVARAWGISLPAVSKLKRRIFEKANQYWE